MKKAKIKDIFNLSSPRLIDEDDLDYIHNVFYSNHEIASKNEEYSDAENRYMELGEKLEKLPSEHLELFEEYCTVRNLLYDYDLCLMYEVGLKKGMIIGEKIK